MKISIFLSSYFANNVCETRFFDVSRKWINLRFLNMSNAHDDALIAQLTHIHEYSSKKNQLKAIKCLRDERDVILFAKTNYEKSMILYSLFALKFDIIILLIFSLNALKMNQCRVIVERIPLDNSIWEQIMREMRAERSFFSSKCILVVF